MNKIIEKVEKDFSIKNNNTLNFKTGYYLSVSINIQEGNKKRIQNFEGIVISIKKKGINTSFTVRKISHNEGIERVFKLYSPIINNIIIKKKGITRKSKLYFLRKKYGKSLRLKIKK